MNRYEVRCVVWNDCGYGAEVHKLVAKGFNEKLAQWESPDFVALAKALGGDGVLLVKRSSEALQKELAELQNVIPN